VHEEEVKTERTLTDADVEAIVTKLQQRWAESFYKDLGKGVWERAKQTIMLAIVLLAAYGAWKGGGNVK